MRLFLFGLLLLGQSGRAQQLFPIRHLTTQDGLSQGSCAHIKKDSRGFVWASSQNGLNRFDGTRFTTYRFDGRDTTTIGKGEIRGLYETTNGDIWVGTEDCLSQYVRRTNSFRRYYATDAAGHRLLTPHQLFWADDSTAWYVNTREGFMKLNYRTGRKTIIYAKFTPRFSLRTEWVEHQPDRHSLVILLPMGFARYNYQTRRFDTFLTGQPSDQAIGDLPKNQSGPHLFQSIHCCRKRSGTYCLAGPQGIFEFDPGFTRLVRHHPLRPGIGSLRFVSMDEDATGRWWLAVEGAGVWLYDPVTMKLLREIKPGPAKASSLLTNLISKVYVDDLGLVWVNGDPFGIDVINPNPNTIETLSDDPTDVTDLNTHSIRGLCEDRQKHIWIGTTDGGLRRFNPATGLMRAYTEAQGVQTAGSSIREIRETRDGRLLTTNLQGLLRYDPARDRFTEVPNPLCTNTDCRLARGILELPDGRFVLATYGGLFTLTADLKPIGSADVSSSYYGSLYYDAAAHRLYAGRRDQDLMVYQYQNGRLIPLYSTLPGHNILSIVPDPHRRCLWLCTDRGLVRFDPATRRPIRTYTVHDGLPDDVVYGLLPDRQGRYWLSTNNGLVKFFPHGEKFNAVVSTLGREYNSQAALIGSDGMFYFGGVHGLDRFVPTRLEQYKAKVPVRIVSFLVNDRPYQQADFIGETGSVTLDYQQRTFSLGLAALDYFSNGKNQFFYQLSGVDRGWVALSDGSTVRYADISPGEYTFQVRAVDARGQLTPVTRLHISILPPLWMRWWFWTLGGLVLLGLVSTGFYSYNRQKLARQRRLLRNTLATQESERRRIASDLHDDVGNTLAAAKGVLELAKAQAAGPHDQSAVTRAYELIDKAGTDLRAITHDLMPVEFEKYALPDVVSQLVERANTVSRVEFEFIVFGTVQKLKPERELVTYRIIAELIQNALKHGGAGLGIVQLGYYTRQLSILVETPVEPKQTNSPFYQHSSSGIGQKNINYRAEYLHAVLTTDSNEQSYTVMLDVPYDATGYPPHSPAHH